MQVIPAILTKTTDEFIFQINSLQKYYQHFQIDIADGQFVANTTISLNDILQTLIDKKINKNPIFDFHLMVNDYEESLEKIKIISNHVKVSTIFIHFSHNPDIDLLSKKYSIYSFGIVLNPEDDINTIMSKYNLKQIKNIQIMSVYTGFQRSAFLPEMMNKIEQLRSLNYGFKIYLDGGINDKTIRIINNADSQPDFLCIGSFLSADENLEEKVKTLQNLI